MTYLVQDAIASSPGMRVRVAQCAAQENVPGDPDQWTTDNRRDWASAPGWEDAWASAMASHPDDGDPDTPAYDPGRDEAVITDAMILSQVQAMKNNP